MPAKVHLHLLSVPISLSRHAPNTQCTLVKAVAEGQTVIKMLDCIARRGMSIGCVLSHKFRRRASSLTAGGATMRTQSLFDLPRIFLDPAVNRGMIGGRRANHLFKNGAGVGCNADQVAIRRKTIRHRSDNEHGALGRRT